MASSKIDDNIDDGFPLNYKSTASHKGTQQTTSKEYEISGVIDLRRNPLSEIQKRIGQVLTWYGDVDDDGDKDLKSGTATVYKRLGDGYYVALTCAHNLTRFDEQTGTKERAKNIYYLCEGEQQRKVRLKCVDFIHHESYNPTLNHCPNDIGIILCYDDKAYYNDIKINECTQLIHYRAKKRILKNCRIDGYPARTKGKLMGMIGTVSHDKDKGEWKYTDLFTYPGQSGSLIYRVRVQEGDDEKDEEDEEYRVYGIHTFGNTEKQTNRGVHLNKKHMNWIGKKERILKQKATEDAYDRAQQQLRKEEEEKKQQKIDDNAILTVNEIQLLVQSLDGEYCRNKLNSALKECGIVSFHRQKIIENIKKYFKVEEERLRKEEKEIFRKEAEERTRKLKAEGTKRRARALARGTHYEATIPEMDAALSRYYHLMGLNYDGLFQTFCDDNGIDEMDIEEELSAPFDECTIVDFDPGDFPFLTTPKNTNKAIYGLLRKIFRNPEYDFEAELTKKTVFAKLFESAFTTKQ